jgi:hypothetical protein
METPKESDQLPEEGPSDQVPEDAGGGQARDEAEENAGASDNPGQATGHPENAG